MHSPRSPYTTDIADAITRGNSAFVQYKGYLLTLDDSNIETLQIDDVQQRINHFEEYCDEDATEIFRIIQGIIVTNKRARAQHLNDLRSEYLRRIQPHIAHKNRSDFDYECANHDCPGIRTMSLYSKWISMVDHLGDIPCAPLQRLLVILDIYCQFMNTDSLWGHVPVHDIFVIDRHHIDDDDEMTSEEHGTFYGHQQIHDDMAHFIQIHSIRQPIDDTDEWTPYSDTQPVEQLTEHLSVPSTESPAESAINPSTDTFDQPDPPHTPSLLNIPFITNKSVRQYLYETLQCREEYKCCEMDQCLIYMRHHRDRQAQREQSLYYKELAENNKSKAQSIRDDRDVILQQDLDRMHSYFLQFGT